jgi:hypothetical protein
MGGFYKGKSGCLLSGGKCSFVRCLDKSWALKNNNEI